ncbi:MAG: diaminopimelate epimerase [bacterium]|nr:diaminopimelate epimerase [bacterium]
MDFYKYHGLGNDYIVIDPAKNGVDLTPERIQLICHRNLGIGSDGILLGPLFRDNKISLKIFNPDGSEAEKSGNGIRIFSRYLVEAGYVKGRRFSLVTAGGTVAVEILEDNASLIRVAMGQAVFTSPEIPVNGEPREVIGEAVTIGKDSYSMTCLSVGNPHSVIPLDAISEELARKLGPLVENHPLFPNRINMQLMRVIDRKNIAIEIWERGAGYTLASGSSSCAAASAARKLGLVDDAVTVYMPGGLLEIEFKGDDIFMTGPVAAVASGNFAPEIEEALGI